MEALRLPPVGTQMNGHTRPDRLRLRTLDHLDGRTLAARRAKDLVQGLESDLGGGDDLTVAVKQLVQRAAVLGAIIEHQEAMWLAGLRLDVNEHLAAINAQRRVLATVGLERRARNVTTLSDVLGRRSP